MRHLSKIVPMLMFLAVAGAGCISFTGGSSQADGGVWETNDAAMHWAQRKVLLSATGLQSLGDTDITTLAIDPEDNQAVYAGTASQGLIYTYDGGDSWTTAKAIAAGHVNSIAVDSKDKCVIYVAIGQRILKSNDCSRSYAPMYYDGRGDVSLTTVVIDWFNSNVVYAGTSAGDLQKSSDGGAHWSTLQRFGDSIQQVVLDPAESRTLFVGLRQNGIWRSGDAGASWADLKDSLRDLDGARGFVHMVADSVTRNTFLVADRYGIIRTTDSGKTWAAMNLPTPPSSVTIYSLAVFPKNVNEITYGTASTYYHSADGGVNWVTKKLPTTRAATALLVDPQSAKTIYLGTTTLKK